MLITITLHEQLNGQFISKDRKKTFFHGFSTTQNLVSEPMVFNLEVPKSHPFTSEPC